MRQNTQDGVRPKKWLDARLDTKPEAQPQKRLDARWPDIVKHMAMSLGHIRSGRRGGVAGLIRRRSPVPVKTNVP